MGELFLGGIFLGEFSVGGIFRGGEFSWEEVFRGGEFSAKLPVFTIHCAII